MSVQRHAHSSGTRLEDCGDHIDIYGKGGLQQSVELTFLLLVQYYLFICISMCIHFQRHIHIHIHFHIHLYIIYVCVCIHIQGILQRTKGRKQKGGLSRKTEAPHKLPVGDKSSNQRTIGTFFWIGPCGSKFNPQVPSRQKDPAFWIVPRGRGRGRRFGQLG